MTCFICETPRVNGFCPVHDDRKCSWMSWQRRVTGLAWPPLASGDGYRRIDHLRALEGRSMSQRGRKAVVLSVGPRGWLELGGRQRKEGRIRSDSPDTVRTEFAHCASVLSALTCTLHKFTCHS